MFYKKILIFMLLCFGINICRAETFIAFDTVALDTAMNEITRVGPDSPYTTIEDAGDALYDAFYAARKNNTVDIDKVTDKCANEIIKSGRICNNFLTAYNKYLNKANYCMKANNFKAVWNNKDYSFGQCYAKYNGGTFRNADGTIDLDPRNPDAGKYASNSLTGQCKSWVDSAEQCRNYLSGYYKDKLDNSNILASDKKYYECLLEKVETGNIDFPTSKMEESCK